MLSKRMTANNLDENPDIQASSSIANVIKLLQPAVLRFITILDDLFIAEYNLSAIFHPNFVLILVVSV